MAGREGFEPSNARSKAWCLTSLATAQRSDLPGSMVNPNRACAAQSTQYQRRTGDLAPSGASFDPQCLARALDKRRSSAPPTSKREAYRIFQGISRRCADKRCYWQDFSLSILTERLRLQRFSHENARFGCTEAKRGGTLLSSFRIGEETENRTAAAAHRGGNRAAFLK